MQENLNDLPELKNVHVIETLDALKALSDALRLHIIEALQREPLTASQIARQLGEKPNKLHYHLVELEKNGLVQVVEIRQKGNLLEKYYRAIAKYYRVAGNLFENVSGPEVLEAVLQRVVTNCDLTVGDLRKAIRAGTFTEREASAALQTVVRWRLAPEQAAEFKQRLHDLIEEYARKRPLDDTGVYAALTVFFYTQVPDTDP